MATCFNDQPTGLSILRISATQRPFAFQFLAGKKNCERAFPEITLHSFVRSDIPNHDSAAAILAFGNDALELQIVDRVVLCLKASARLTILERNSLRHRPRLQHVVHFQSKVVMEMTCCVFLHNESAAASLSAAAWHCRHGFCGTREVSFGAIIGERCRSFSPWPFLA